MGSRKLPCAGRRTALVVVVLGGLLASPSHAQSERGRARGSLTWRLCAAGEEADLAVSRDRRRAEPAGEGSSGWSADAAWGDWSGTFTMSRSAQTRESAVLLQLEHPDGRDLECRGYIVRRDTRDLDIAGTFSLDGQPGAWYAAWASRRNRAVEAAAGVGAEEELRSKLEQAMAESTETQRKLQQKDAALRELRQELDALERRNADLQKQQASSRRAPPPDIRSLTRGLSGRYAAASDEKSDQVASMEFPPPPVGVQQRWLVVHTNLLQEALAQVYSPADMSRFQQEEQRACTGRGVYCQMAFRQQAILRLVHALHQGGR